MTDPDESDTSKSIREFLDDYLKITIVVIFLYYYHSKSLSLWTEKVINDSIISNILDTVGSVVGEHKGAINFMQHNADYIKNKGTWLDKRKQYIQTKLGGQHITPESIAGYMKKLKTADTSNVDLSKLTTVKTSLSDSMKSGLSNVDISKLVNVTQDKPFDYSQISDTFVDNMKQAAKDKSSVLKLKAVNLANEVLKSKLDKTGYSSITGDIKPEILTQALVDKLSSNELIDKLKTTGYQGTVDELHKKVTSGIDTSQIVDKLSNQSLDYLLNKLKPEQKIKLIEYLKTSGILQKGQGGGDGYFKKIEKSSGKGGVIGKLSGEFGPKSPFKLFKYWMFWILLLLIGLTIIGVLIIRLSIEYFYPGEGDDDSFIITKVLQYIWDNISALIWPHVIYCILRLIFDILKFDGFIIPILGEIVEVVERIPILWSIIFGVYIFTTFYAVLSVADRKPSDCKDNLPMKRCVPALWKTQCPEDDSSWYSCWFKI